MKIFLILIFGCIAFHRQVHSADINITAKSDVVYEVNVHLASKEKAFQSGLFYRGQIEVSENGVKYFGIEKKVRKARMEGYTVAVTPIEGNDNGKHFSFNINIGEYVFFKDESKFSAKDSDLFIVDLPKNKGSVTFVLETSDGMVRSNQADIFSGR